MAISDAALISAIRKKRVTQSPFAVLLSMLDSRKSVYRRITDYKSNITIGSDEYQAYPFAVNIPASSSRFSQKVEVVFANFPGAAGLPTLKADLEKAARADFEVVSAEAPNIKLFEKNSYLFSHDDSLNVTNDLIKITFSLKILEDKKFPFTRYNSNTHPLLYADFVPELF